MKVVGYSYDAGLHCPKCTMDMARKVEYKDYVWDGDITDEDIEVEYSPGIFDMSKAIELGVIRDSEGNEIHAIFDTDEAGDTPDHCEDCGAYIDTQWHSETVIYAIGELWDYVESYVDLSKGKGNPEVLDIWAGELSMGMQLDRTDEFVLFMYYAVRRNWEDGI